MAAVVADGALVDQRVRGARTVKSVRSQRQALAKQRVATGALENTCRSPSRKVHNSHVTPRHPQGVTVM